MAFRKYFRRGFWPTAGVAVFGIVISLVSFSSLRDFEFDFAKQDFVGKASEDTLVIKAAIAEDLDKVSDLRALFETFPNAVSQAEFKVFTKKLIERNTSILGSSWVVRVKREERAAHEAEGSRQGIPGYRIRTIDPLGQRSAVSPERDEYFPVMYVTDAPSSSAVYGLDMGSEEGRLKTIEQARDTGQIAISPIIALQSGRGGRDGFFACLPVYRSGLRYGSPEERRINLIGFVQVVFRISTMIESIFNARVPARDLDFYFFGPQANLT
jgi:CHASE1-domain containing sensor protein